MKLNTDGAARDSAGGGGVEEYWEMNTATGSTGLLEIVGRWLVLWLNYGLSGMGYIWQLLRTFIIWLLNLMLLLLFIWWKNSVVNFSLEPLLTDCRLLLKKFPNLRIEHVYRESDQCADALARIGSTSDVPFLLFAHPPPVVDRLCTLDIERAFCNRLV